MCEPCVGSGGMVIGLAHAMHKNNLNYCNQMVVHCCDIDIKCVHMAYLQLSLYGIPAVIIHGNSLTLEEWSRWHTPVYMTNGWLFKERMENPLQTIQEISKENDNKIAVDMSQEDDECIELDTEIKEFEQLSLF